MIEVRDLVKKYGDHVAVDHLSFTAEKGKIYGFLGPNGAGKSTTMNMMTGYLASTSGEVLIDGHDILKEPEKAKKHIGYLPEVPPLYMEMTPYEQLHFAAELRGIARGEREACVVQVMQETGIEEMADRLIRNLSKGYRQRVGLAQALLGDPDILILDEPTAGLDPLQITEIRTLIRRLSSEHTIILSSHILSEVSAVCDEVLIISHGKLVASDTPDNLGHLLTGKETLHLKVKGKIADVEAALKTISGVQQVTAEQEGDLTSVNVQLKGRQSTGGQAKAGKDAQQSGSDAASAESRTPDAAREAIFYRLAEKRLSIYEMESAHASLEKVFLELTEDEIEKEAE